MGVGAYILAGGKSRRFGSDKALAMVEGRPLIARLADRVRPHVARVTVVAERVDKYAHLGLRTIGDVVAGLGPLGGLRTALEDMEGAGGQSPRSSSHPRPSPRPSPGVPGEGERGVPGEGEEGDGWLLLVSCDLLTFQADWLEVLLRHRSAGARAVAFKPDVWQPLLALYHRSIRPWVLAHLATDDRSMQSLLNDAGAVEAPLPADWPAVLGANRPEDLPRTAGLGD
jgi:molybdopterin-guanine dinucleotide biosynthesis protein A